MDNLPCILSDSSGNMEVPFVDPNPITKGRRSSRARRSIGDYKHHGRVMPIQKEEEPYNRKRSTVLASDDDLINKKRRKTARMPPPLPAEKRNIRCLKGLKMLRDECKDNQARMSIKSFEIICFGDPLKDLGLHLKKEYCLGEDDEEEELLQSWECELGEIKKETYDHDRKTNIEQLERKELNRNERGKEEEPYNRKRSTVLVSYDDLTNKKRRKTARMPPPLPAEKRNIRCLKGLKMLRDECKDDQARMSIKSFEIICFGDPLKDLGLHLKKEYCLGEDDEEEELLQSWERELGEIKKETCDHDRKKNIEQLERNELNRNERGKEEEPYNRKRSTVLASDDDLTNKKRRKTARMPPPLPAEKRIIRCLKGLKMLCDECKDDQARMRIKSFEIICFGDPLKDLGLHLKKEYCLGEDEEEEELLQSWECELGEIKKETCDHDRKKNIEQLERKELNRKERGKYSDGSSANRIFSIDSNFNENRESLEEHEML